MAAALAALTGCGRNPASGEPDRVSDLPGAYDSSTTGTVLAALQANEDAQSRHRMLASEGEEDTAVYGRLIATPSFAILPGGNPPVSGSRRPPAMASALLKRAFAVPEASGWGNPADTTGLRYGDSAKGYIQQVRQAVLTDSLGQAQVRDSLVFKWPYSPGSPAVLAHVQRRTYADGRATGLQVFDEDGDGILNEAGAGKVIKLRKEWTLRSADTLWKTAAWTTHGQTTYYDSLGTGALSTWTDSAFVAGQAAWWQRFYDGDGDGMALTAAAGVRVKVLRDAFAAHPDGSIRLDYEGYLAGPDGDFLASADNERLPFRSLLIDSRGKDRVGTVFGDGDGDGYWWSPAAGAPNLGLVVNTHAPSESLAAFRDSTVLRVPASPAAAPAILAYSAEARRPDGMVTAWSTRLGRGAAAFSGGDTVQVRERVSYAAYAAPAGHPAADWDSTLTVGWLVPGDFGSTADDRLVQWYSEIHFKAGRPRSRTAELLKAEAPFAPGAAPVSGTFIREEHFRPVTGKSLVSVAETRAFGAASPDKPWKRVRRFENGDSTVATGRVLAGGARAYVQALGPGKRAAGRRDASTGGFVDTVTWLDAGGEAVAREITSGVVDRGAGTGEYRRRREAAGSHRVGQAGPAGDTAEVRFLLTREGSARGFLRISGDDTLSMTVSGDTVHCRRDFGDRRAIMRWHPSADGTFALRQSVDSPSREGILGLADYVFGADGAGSGVHARTLDGGAAREGKVEFRADGSAYYDGIRVAAPR